MQFFSECKINKSFLKMALKNDYGEFELDKEILEFLEQVQFLFLIVKQLFNSL